MTHDLNADAGLDPQGARDRNDRAAILPEQASAICRQLRQLLADRALMAEPELRLALAEELLQEIDVLSVGMQRPAVRQASARVRHAIGLPTSEAVSAIPMSVDTALAFLSLAISPPDEMHVAARAD